MFFCMDCRRLTYQWWPLHKGHQVYEVNYDDLMDLIKNYIEHLKPELKPKPTNY